MMALYSLTEIRAIELAAQRTLPAGSLMQQAGAVAADLALSLLPAHTGGQKVLFLAGPGNNGGDALDAAARLAQSCDVALLLFADPAALPIDAAQAYARARQSTAEFLDTARALDILKQDWSLIVDGLFGIGLSRPIGGALRELIQALNGRRLPVLALDIPSGLDADTGKIVGKIIGDDGIAVEASHTITFIADKPGLHTCDGRDHAGAVSVADLAIDPALFPAAHALLNEPPLFTHAIQPRRHNTHKGSYGDVAIVGGASGMVGAAFLAARAAAKAGAGRTFIAFAGDAPELDHEQPELMCRQAQGFDFSKSTVVIGPGLGTSDLAHDMLVRALQTDTPLVLDADALNLIAHEPALQQQLATRRAPSLMTPHPLEAARLLGLSSAAVQADRPAAARALAGNYRSVVVLKGSGSIIADADGKIVINPTGNPGLATAGSGDVLSGLCGALLAQGWPVWETALGAVWLHGSAGDLLVQQGIGPIGLTAGELIAPIRTLLNQLTVK